MFPSAERSNWRYNVLLLSVIFPVSKALRLVIKCSFDQSFLTDASMSFFVVGVPVSEPSHRRFKVPDDVVAS